MKRHSRREFMEKAAGFSAAAALSPWISPLRGATSVPTAQGRVVLGKTGIETSRVAMGTGFHGGARSSAQVRLGKKEFIRLMRHGFDHGLNFYDLADLYGSHPFMKDVIAEIGRDRLVLLSKIWFADSAGMEPTDRAIPPVNRFRKELGVDMIDICLIHCVTDAKWPSQLQRIRDELSELKERGAIRATGCSCHDFGALEVAAEDPWVDVIFARINHASAVMDHSDPNQVAKVLRTARSNGKAVVGMKIYGAGRLTEKPAREKSLRYVWGNELIDAMTIGFEQEAQVDDTVQHLNSVLQSLA